MPMAACRTYRQAANRTALPNDPRPGPPSPQIAMSSKTAIRATVSVSSMRAIVIAPQHLVEGPNYEYLRVRHNEYENEENRRCRQTKTDNAVFARGDVALCHGFPRIQEDKLYYGRACQKSHSRRNLR
jgi:hypothetical protein